MIGNGRKYLGLLLAAFATGTASADVIRPGTASPLTAPVAPTPEVSRREAAFSDSLTLNEAMLGTDWNNELGTPLALKLLLVSTLETEVALTDLPRPTMPPDPLLGAGSERMMKGRAIRGVDVAGNHDANPTPRIPEPLSITLVIVGIIGLVARGHLRRQAHV